MDSKDRDPNEWETSNVSGIKRETQSQSYCSLDTSNKAFFERIQPGKENHSQEQSERLCFACNKSLSRSRHLINVSGQLHRWHSECFKCYLCNHSLDRETSCHVYRDKIVCRDDYAKLQRDQSTKCSRCRWPISASDWVRKAGEYVYHLACFSCDICLRQMSTGEQFTINIQDKNLVRLLCRLHFATESNNHSSSQKLSPNMNITDLSTSSAQFDFTYARHSAIPSATPTTNKTQQNFNHRDQFMHPIPSNSGCQADNQALLQNRSSEFEEATSHMAHQLSVEDSKIPDNQRTDTSTLSSNGSASCMMGLPSKSKRVRTTFTEDQLSILQTHFMIDSNPDGQDLERIATITGLSKRVTQVWFQNSRARQKKHNTKRKPSCMSTPSSSIGLPGGSSIQPHVFGHNQQQQRHHSIETSNGQTAHDCFQTNSHQEKWSSMSSDRSSVSLDAGEVILDELEDSRSTDNDQIAISEESNE